MLFAHLSVNANSIVMQGHAGLVAYYKEKAGLVYKAEKTN